MSVFSLYVHIPYCQAKCPYCDFNSYAARRWPEQRYVAALRTELRRYATEAPWDAGRLGTIFFGGGTPSLFSADSIAALLGEAAQLWDWMPEVEVTLEANPGTVSLDKLRGFRGAGVNRMSFGVQSFAAHHLRALGRIHSSEEAVDAVHAARAAGFDNVNVDLIFALPTQTLSEWESDVARACALQPEHLSAYNLTYEAGTPFHQLRRDGVLRQLPEEIEVGMFTRTQELLAAAGYEQYEISNYARPGRACRHNLNYWRGGDYLGVGAGAHSYRGGRGARVSLGANDWGCRWSNEKLPERYMDAVEHNGHAHAGRETLDVRQAQGEFMFLGLRCHDGVSVATFRERFGAEVATVFPHLADLQADGLIEVPDDRTRLTPRGRLLSDSVFATFL